MKLSLVEAASDLSIAKVQARIRSNEFGIVKKPFARNFLCIVCGKSEELWSSGVDQVDSYLPEGPLT